MPWVKQSDLNNLKTSSNELLKLLEDLKKQPRLVAINDAGRTVKLVFERYGELYEFEFIKTLSLDLVGMKSTLVH